MNLPKKKFGIAMALGLSLAGSLHAQEISPEVKLEERRIADKQEYFLIEHADDPAEKKGLVIILPGGPGTRDFMPFCANVLTRFAVPKGFMVAELIAPQWSTDENRTVWAGEVFKDENAKFTTEKFISAVIEDIAKERKLDTRHVFTLGWSSSGHVLYSASTRVPEVTGSIIAMSRFFPAVNIEKDKAKGKNFFLYHSPEDQVCPFADAERAVETLTELEANVKLVEYKGGHGWQPGSPHWQTIREAVEWLMEKVGEADSN